MSFVAHRKLSHLTMAAMIAFVVLPAAARGAGQVTESIESVKYGAGETGAAAAQVLSAAQELARYAENLGREVEDFLSGVKVA